MVIWWAESKGKWDVVTPMYQSTYFTKKETGCRCGDCNRKQGMSDEHLRRMDILRRLCGFVLNMTSGYRCPDHPTNPTGPHGDCASDVMVSRRQAYIVVQKAMLLGFTGIGVKQKGNKRFIHLDDCLNTIERPRPCIWSY